MLLFIITIPAFLRILNNQYFSMHDDQHIVRLFLLDQGLRQGYLYPRWVDGLGFGFGYPLYNFYPPLIYYIGELFHLIGFSLVWSIKLTFILGFYLGSIGIYLFVKKLTNRLSGFLSATLYTYFFYHAVLIYVRGALAEFFSLVIIPFIFLTIHDLSENLNLRRAIIFGLSFALLILTHPLVALPSVILIGFLFLFYFFKLRFNPSISLRTSLKFVYLFICGLILGLSLSAFFWLPSMVERKFTLTDKILTGELASYKLHYIYPQQFIYSPWGFGGSGAGLTDGMTFQLGKIHIGLAVLSLVLFFIYLKRNKKVNHFINYYLLSTLLLIFSLFMTTEYSFFIWDSVRYLWYLQFPWRFLTFTNIFISIVGGYFFYFLSSLLRQSNALQRWVGALVGLICLITIFTYQKYFYPQKLLEVRDKDLITYEEVAWRISRTSYEFVPKEVKTKKSALNTTILTIEKKDLPRNPYELLGGEADVKIIDNRFQNKEFFIDAKSSTIFRLNTYNFPGWKAYLTPLPVIPSPSTIAQGKLELRNLKIFDNNDLKLITVYLPQGEYNLNFVFKNTLVRITANLITFVAFVLILLFLKFKKVDR